MVLLRNSRRATRVSFWRQKRHTTDFGAKSTGRVSLSATGKLRGSGSVPQHVFWRQKSGHVQYLPGTEYDESSRCVFVPVRRRKGPRTKEETYQTRAHRAHSQCSRFWRQKARRRAIVRDSYCSNHILSVDIGDTVATHTFQSTGTVYCARNVRVCRLSEKSRRANCN